MEKSSKRGKIPQHDWPSIISRYESGETLASIARTYDCSPPAISYIVSRTRARNMAGDGAGTRVDLLATTEPQLVKAAAFPVAIHDISDDELMQSSNPPENSNPETIQLSPTEQSADMPGPRQNEWSADPPSAPQPVARDDGSAPRDGDKPRDSGLVESAVATGNGNLRPSGTNGGSPPLGEARRTLHLSLPQGNGPAAAAGQHPATHDASNFDLAADVRPTLQPRQPSVQAPHFTPAREANAMRAPAMMPDVPTKARASSAFIDHTLRERINEDIAAFLTAFDAALDQDTAESRTELREATDRLLRAGARTRIELERLEARVPLAAREAGQRPFPAPRAR